MTMRPFADFKPGQRTISASELNRLTNRLERHDRVSGTGDLLVDNNTTGILFSTTTPKRVMAKITSGPDGQNRYGWSEVIWRNDLSPPQWQVWAAGRTDANLGLPAYEFNNATATVGNVYELRLSPDQRSYNFLAGGGGGSVTLLSSVLPGNNTQGQTIPANTVTPVKWTAAADQFFAGGTDTKFTIPNTQPSGGKYLLAGKAIFQASDQASDYGAGFYLNGDRSTMRWNMPGSCSGHSIAVMEATGKVMGPGDYVEFCVYHNFTNSVKLDTVGMSIHYVGNT